MIVCATAVASKIHTSTICLFTAQEVVRVIVRVAAELFVTVFVLNHTGTVAAFPVAVMALFVHITCANVCTHPKVWLSVRLASVFPSTATTHADTRDSVESLACHNSIEPAVKAFVVQ